MAIAPTPTGMVILLGAGLASWVLMEVRQSARRHTSHAVQIWDIAEIQPAIDQHICGKKSVSRLFAIVGAFKSVDGRGLFYSEMSMGNLKFADTEGWIFAEKNRDGSCSTLFL